MDITAKNINKAFDGKIVLKDFSYRFKSGKTTAVMGPSGCGKSTLLSVLMGILSPDSGEVSVPKPISAVFQENRLCENLTLSANIRLVTGKKYSRREIAEQLAAVGLEGCENKRARELSGGMKRRGALLRALLADYEALFLDEPFKGLDKDTKLLVMNYCKEKTKGRTVIMVTHDIEECELLADETVQLKMI